jgi:hypothetical protein
MLRDRFEEVGDGRLAVRPGHSSDRHVLGRVLIEGRGEGAEDRPHGGDDSLRDVEIEHSLDEERSGAFGDGPRGEVMAVHDLSRDAAEQITGRYPP